MVQLEEARKPPPLQLAVEEEVDPLMEEALRMPLHLEVEEELDPPVEEALPPPLQLYQPPPPPSPL